MSRKDKCMEILMIVFTVLILIFGLILLNVSAWSYANEKEFPRFLSGPAISKSLITVMILGIVIVLAGCLGLIGTIKKSYCLLGTFLGIMLLLFVAQLVAQILIFAFNHKTKKELAKFEVCIKEKSCVDSFAMYQIKFKCCGLNGKNDWNGEVPESCYGGDNDCKQNSSLSKCKGCKAVINHYYWVVNGISLAALFLQGVIIGLTCYRLEGMREYKQV